MHWERINAILYSIAFDGTSLTNKLRLHFDLEIVNKWL